MPTKHPTAGKAAITSRFAVGRRERGLPEAGTFANSIIALDLQTFHRSRQSGNVTGVIYLELEGAAYPERGWSDFPVIILGWWAEAWLQLEMPTRREVQWRFMDGPHTARLIKVPGARLHSPQVYTSLLEAGERVVAHCEQNGMISRDLELLRDNVRRLKANPRSAEDIEFAVRFAFGCQRPGASDSER